MCCISSYEGQPGHVIATHGGIRAAIKSCNCDGGEEALVECFLDRQLFMKGPGMRVVAI